jgi:DNA mismatch repair ATPase MutS
LPRSFRALAIATHLAERRFCWAGQTCMPEVRLDDVYNPFLDDPMPLDIELVREGIFLSGRNGIGKSTLLRTLGLNLIVGRAYGFCYAKDACVPLLPLMTSIKVEDSLDSGTSLYIAELQRAQAMVQASRGKLPCVFIIDEIFRGTNHVDSVSASTAVLNALGKTQSLVIVSSHNVILASILKQRLRPMLVDYLPDQVPTKLQLAPGVLLEPNALSLLTAFDFGARIEQDATSVQQWLSDYLTYPNSSPVLS